MKHAAILHITLAVLVLSQLSCAVLLPSSQAAGEGQTSVNKNVPAALSTIHTTSPDIEDGVIARQYLEELAEFGSRSLKQSGHEKAFLLITSALEDWGYTPEVQAFRTQDNLNARNIVVEKPGRSDRVIIAGGHYDSVRVGSGVDDNGSGVAVLLEAAHRLKDMETPYTIRFIFFDAEETGLEGSGFYVGKMPPADVKKTVAMINLDSLAVGDYTYIYGNEGDDGEIRDWALNYAEENGLDLITQSGKNPDYPAGTTVDESDHAPFLYRGIQYAYLEATNWDLGEMDGYTQVDGPYGDEGEIWHTKYDSLEYIEKTFPGRLDEHLALFSNVLMHILTDFREAD